MKIKLAALILLVAISLSLGACAVKLPPPKEMTPEEEAQNMGFTAAEYNGVIEVGEYEFLKAYIKIAYESEITWSSADPKIATVDSRGRVDGIKAGKTVITAAAKNAVLEYDIEVVKASAPAVSYTTAFIENTDVAEANAKSNADKSLYAMYINEYNSSVTVLTYDIEGSYSVPVRSMICSTAKEPISIKEDATGLRYEISDKAEWINASDGNYYRYVTYLGDDFMFMSTPYSDEDPSTLITAEYNKLGLPVADDHIRLSVADAKWIYENCDIGTPIRVINSANNRAHTPLGVPKSMKLTENSISLNWDPTDDDENNPYAKLGPVMSGVEDVVVEVNKGFDIYGGIEAIDTCSNALQGKVKVDGNFDKNTEGEYIVSYYATDDMGRTCRIDRKITVVKDLEKE